MSIYLLVAVTTICTAIIAGLALYAWYVTEIKEHVDIEQKESKTFFYDLIIKK